MPYKNLKPLRESYWRNGYWYIELKPKHWTLKSRYLIETAIGRKLTSYEEVRYKDGNTHNCTLPNLKVQDFLNRTQWWLDDNGNTVTQGSPVWCRKYHQCRNCGTNVKLHKGLGLCTSCYYLDYWGKM